MAGGGEDQKDYRYQNGVVNHHVTGGIGIDVHRDGRGWRYKLILLLLVYTYTDRWQVWQG